MPISQRILHPAWRREYEPTPYPFGDWASLQNSAGTFLPEGTFLDAALYPVGGGSRLRLSQVVVSDQTIRLYIGDDSNARLCWGDLDVVESLDEIRLVDQYNRPAGLLVSTAQRLLIFQTWTPGTHEFSFAEAGFSSHVCLPVPESRFRGFLLDDGTVVTDDIWLIGDDGIVLSLQEEEVPDFADPTQTVIEQRVRVDVVGDPLFRQRLCTNAPSTPNFVKTVTFVQGCSRIACGPDSLGEIKMGIGRLDSVGTILRIRNVDGAIRIETVGESLDR